jgi:hypothetical protein
MENIQKKRMIIFGNKIPEKELTKEQIGYINSSDVIVRVNRMNNIHQTGERVDWWHPDICNGWLNFINDDEKIKDINFNQISKIFLNYKSYKRLLIDNEMRKLFADRIFKMDYRELKNSKFDPMMWRYLRLKHQNKYWEIKPGQKVIPTTTICLLSHFVEKFSSDYDIYIFGIDVENIGNLFHSNPIWKDTWHHDAGFLEEKYLKDLISKGKIRELKEDFKI